MKTLALIVALTLVACAETPRRAEESSLQDMPQPAQGEQHEWLQQLVGEWTATSEMTMATGAEPMRMEFTESVRSIGGLWILAEGSASIGGSPMTTLMTLGYDPAKKKFIGTWVDTMQAHMWSYEGTLDDAKKVLTLSTTGPAFEDPTKTSKYRDAIEIKSKDHKVLTSSVENADGTWNTFQRAEYKRKK